MILMDFQIGTRVGELVVLNKKDMLEDEVYIHFKVNALNWNLPLRLLSHQTPSKTKFIYKYNLTRTISGTM